MNENLTTLEGIQVSCIFKGLFWSLIITFILSIFFSILLQYTSFSESLMSGFSTFIFFISMFLGSTLAAFSAGHKGLLYSTTVSFTYFFLILLLGLFCSFSAISLALILKKGLLTIASSLLGGIIGIGLISH